MEVPSRYLNFFCLLNADDKYEDEERTRVNVNTNKLHTDGLGKTKQLSGFAVDPSDTPMLLSPTAERESTIASASSPGNYILSGFACQIHS